MKNKKEEQVYAITWDALYVYAITFRSITPRAYIREWTLRNLLKVFIYNTRVWWDYNRIGICVETGKCLP